MPNWSTSYFEFYNINSGESTRDHGLADIEDRILLRVRSLLSSRSEQEIDEIILITDAICSDYFLSGESRLSKMADIERSIEKGEIKREDAYSENLLIPKHGTVAPEYLVMMSEYDLDSLTCSIDVQWYEIFAFLALNLVGEAVAEDEYQRSENYTGYKQEDYMRLYFASYYLFDAYEVLTIAEKIRISPEPKANIDEAANRKLSLQNSLAAKIKHAPIQKIKAQFVKWYFDHLEAGQFKSKADAARKFYSALSESEGSKLAPTNAERTLKDALRDFEKGRTNLKK